MSNEILLESNREWLISLEEAAEAGIFIDSKHSPDLKQRSRSSHHVSPRKQTPPPLVPSPVREREIADARRY